MISKSALIAPLALTLSVAAFAQARDDAVSDSPRLTADASQVRDKTSKPGLSSILLGFEAPCPAPEARQVRIERKVTIRISPQSRAPRTSLMADLPQQAAPPRLVERKMDDCVAVSSIAGVQTSGADRLILYLRDRRMVSAQLERSCKARDFYSGFYLEKNDDGRLCVKRDKLQSRSGANCEVERMRQLVAEE